MSSGECLTHHVADYIADLRRRDCSKDHVGICEKYLAIVLAQTNWKTLGDISAASFQRALIELQSNRNIKTSTINRYIARTKGFTRWMHEGRRIGVDPLVSIRFGRENLGQRRGLTNREIIALLKAPRTRREVYQFLMLTGLRRGECEELCWGDVHDHAAVPFLALRTDQTKNGYADQLELHPTLLPILRRPVHASASDLVFARVPSKAELLADIRAGGVDPDREGVGLVDLHSLRHTFDRLVVETGCTVKEAAALMRHRDPKMTMNVYARLGVSEARGIMARVVLPTTAPPPYPPSHSLPGTGLEPASLAELAPQTI